jgi:DNA-binding response OmpR family regulator
MARINPLAKTGDYRILVADDEQDLAWAVRHSLKDEGYEVLVAYDGLEALALARRHRPDLIVLDIVMPRLDGLGVCHRLRQDTELAALPIIFLTERAAVEDRVTGLNQGGDDYIAKPFDLRELKARIRALLRRSRPTPPGHGGGDGSRLLAGPLTLDLRTRQVYRGGTVIQLTPAECDVLAFLMRHPDHIFSSQQLLEQTWGYPPESAEPGLVRWHMKNLRSKIEPDPAHPLYFRTIPHQGYILKL